MDESNTITVTQTYHFALNPTPTQQRMLASHVGAVRFIYNRMLAEVKADMNRYNSGSSTVLDGWSQSALRRCWNANKGQWAINPVTGEIWWSANARDAHDTGLFNLANALKQWCDSRSGKHRDSSINFPQFKKKSQRMGIRFGNDRVRLADDRKHVRFPRIGWIKTHESMRKLARRIENGTARILTVTVKEDSSGRWHVSFTCEVQRQQCRTDHVKKRADAVGIDVGVKHLATIARSDGSIEYINNPQPLEHSQKKIRKLNRKQSRQQNGSNRQKRTKKRIGKTHRRAANIRKDKMTKLTTKLAQQHDIVAVETLNVKDMASKKPGMGKVGRKFNRSLNDSSVAELRRQLQYKCHWYGSTLVEADQFYPSSKTCSDCGEVKAKLSTSERTFKCKNCGLIMDRDENAARNLLRLVEEKGPEVVREPNGRGAEHKTSTAQAVEAAGNEASTLQRESCKTGTVLSQGITVTSNQVGQQA